MDKGTFFLSMIVIVAAAGIGWGVWWYYSDAVPERQSEWQTMDVGDEQAGKVTIETQTAGFVPESQMAVKAFFGNSTKAATGEECSAVFPVVRYVPKTSSVARAALTELLKGPTSEEAAMGYSTVLNADSELRSLKLENGVLYADFNSNLGEGMAGSCAVSAVRAEITETAKQFATVKDVVISIDGATDDILQP